jgi:hypothetical protein
MRFISDTRLGEYPDKKGGYHGCRVLSAVVAYNYGEFAPKFPLLEL